MSAAGPRPGAAGFLEGELQRALDDPALRVLELAPIGGGCIHHAVRVRTSRGDWFAKWNDDCAPDLFLSEERGLLALREARSLLAIPEVLVALPPGEGRPACIVMDYLPPRAPKAGDDAALGSGLAAIHARPGDAFGFPVTSYCGPTAQDNRSSPSWPEFYAERRLRPLAQRLDQEHRIGPPERRALDRLIERLPSLLAHAPRPALIHGDLWSGNVLATTRGPALVDPACSWADREMEFGITTLFGGFSERSFAAYDEALPLPTEWRSRNPLYQLYHLLNHHLIFGGHYGASAFAIVKRHV